MKLIPNVTRVILAALIVMSAGSSSAQTMGATVKTFNLLANAGITLTGFAADPFNISNVGIAPGVALTLTNASVTTSHLNNVTSINGQSEAAILSTSLTNPPGATFIALAAATLPPALFPGPGITVYTAAANVTNGVSVVTITGSPTSVVIFQIGTFMTLTDTNVILAGGISPSNVYWKVTNDATIINNDAVDRTMPGTIIVTTTPDDVAVTVSNAGSLSIGRLIAIGGDVTVTQSGAGRMIMALPTEAPAVAVPGALACTDGLFYPSPATGAVGTFAYCMDSAGSVKIRVYNVIGDLAVKIDDTKPAGAATSTIDTARLAPGVYLYILERDYGAGNKARSRVKKFAVKH